MKNKKIVIFFVLFFLALAIIFFAYEKKYSDKIYPGTYIGEIDIGGKTYSEAEEEIFKQLNQLNQKGVNFIALDRVLTVYPLASSLDAGLLEFLISFDVDDTLNKALAVGRNAGVIDNLFKKIRPLWGNNNYVTLTTNIDNEKVSNLLKEEFSVLSPQNAYYYFDSDNNLMIEPGKDGKKVNYEKALLELKSNLESLDFSNIVVETIDAEPEISEEDCLSTKEELNGILEMAPITLKYLRKEWIINQEDLLEMIVLSRENSILRVRLDENKIAEYLKENVAPGINQRAELPKFSFQDGIVENFSPGQEGKELDIDSTVELIKVGTKEIELKVNALPFPESNEQTSDLGIKEIIGEYSLAFIGSTVARTSNIQNGADSLNGLLLKPGEEFSTLKALGEMSEENGYQKEAVIKRGAFYYELGGGLCHLSTTLFRTVLKAGLPITMRQNHSYNMPYYQPPGIDATIYDPEPDFRFVNDTGNHILIQTEVVDQELYIKLWGTKDGRKIERTDPVVYNVVKPLPTRYVRSYSLASGQTQCTAPYNGADTYFDYIVTYPDGTVKEKRFKSHYVPRQGVCLVGA